MLKDRRILTRERRKNKTSRFSILYLDCYTVLKTHFVTHQNIISKISSSLLKDRLYIKINMSCINLNQKYHDVLKVLRESSLFLLFFVLVLVRVFFVFLKR